MLYLKNYKSQTLTLNGKIVAVYEVHGNTLVFQQLLKGYQETVITENMIIGQIQKLENKVFLYCSYLEGNFKVEGKNIVKY